VDGRARGANCDAINVLRFSEKISTKLTMESWKERLDSEMASRPARAGREAEAD